MNQPAATAGNQYRWGIMADIGCVPCIIEGEKRNEDRRETPPDMHHLIDGYRRGHEFTVAACPWHHRGIRPDSSRSVRETRTILGPSLALTPMAFTMTYGTDDELLERQEQLIAKWKENKI